jgi:hypothetical protein
MGGVERPLLCHIGHGPLGLLTAYPFNLFISVQGAGAIQPVVSHTADPASFMRRIKVETRGKRLRQSILIIQKSV